MYIYIIYFFAILLSGWLWSQKKLQTGRIGLFYFSIIAVALIAMIGLRAECIGTDTIQYAFIWNYDIKAGNYGIIDTDAELGYYYLQTFFKQFIDYQAFLVVIAIVSIIPIFWVIHKYSQKWALAILVFYSSIAFHTLEFAAARQALSFTGVIIAYHFIHERSLKKFLITILVSFIFHRSALIFLPCYWLYNIQITKKTILIWCGALAISFLLAHTIFAFLNSFSRIDYSTSEVEAGGERYFMVMVMFVILGFINRDRINQSPLIRFPFVLYCLAPLLWPILNGNPALYRLQYYFEFFLCLFMPNLLCIIPKSNILRAVMYCFTILIGLYIVLYMRSSEAYYPYYFFWEK